MYDKPTLAKGMGASFAAVAMIVLIVASTGTAYALPLAGAGGFTIKADKITADTQVIYPGTEDTSNSGQRPMIVVEQKNTKIKGLVIIKEFPASSLPGVKGDARFLIKSNSEVTINKQLLKMSKFNAKQSKFSGQVLDEHNSDKASEKFEIRSGPASNPQDGKTVNIDNSKPGVVLKDVKIKAHYLANDQISLPDQDFVVQYDADGDGKYNESGG